MDQRFNMMVTDMTFEPDRVNINSFV